VPAGLGRDVDPRRPRHPYEVALDLPVEVVAAVLVDEIPLVEGEHQRAAGLDHHRDDPEVLLGQRLAGVDEDDRDLGLLQRGLGAQHRVVLRPGCLVRTAPDPGGVDEPPGLAAELDQLVDRVDRGAGDLVDHRAVLAGDLVEQAGLADVRLAQQRDPRGSAEAAPASGRLGQRREHGVEQVAAAAAVQGGDGVRLAQAQRPQPRGVGLGTRVVHLVGGEHHGLAGAPEHLHHGLVGVGRADPWRRRRAAPRRRPRPRSRPAP
jgi:hypothetical protein